MLCLVNSAVCELGSFVFQVIYPHHSKLSEKEVSQTGWVGFLYKDLILKR